MGNKLILTNIQRNPGETNNYTWENNGEFKKKNEFKISE